MQRTEGYQLLPCGVCVLDTKNNIVEVNDILLSWLGAAEQDTWGKNITALLPAASKLLYLGNILPMLQTQAMVVEQYISLNTAQGKSLPVLFNAHKKVVASQILYVFTFIKMQRRNLIEEQLVFERRQALEAKNEKERLYTELKYSQAKLIANQKELIDLNKSLEVLSITDVLTGTSNRRFYDQQVMSFLRQFYRSSQKFSLILVDIDYFKIINDTYGHDVGDILLRTATQELRKNLREIDILARIGGDEFAILLPDSGVGMAKIVAERHRKAILNINLKSIDITASFGIAEVQLGDTEKSLYSNADKALYQSKDNGRNCVT